MTHKIMHHFPILIDQILPHQLIRAAVLSHHEKVLKNLRFAENFTAVGVEVERIQEFHYYEHEVGLEGDTALHGGEDVGDEA